MTGPITKSRVLYDQFPRGRWTANGTTWFQASTTPPYRDVREKVLYTTSNPGPPYRKGSGFICKKSGTTRSVQKAQPWEGAYNYEGYYMLNTLPDGSPAAIPDLTTTLWGKGATGIARARPGNSEADLAVFLGELSSLPKQLYQAATGSSRPSKVGKNRGAEDGAGSTFLGIQFGLLPTINDLKKLYQLQTTLSSKLSQLRRDNGKLVRRRVGISSNETSVAIAPYNFVNVVPSTNMTSSQELSVLKTTTEKYWFSGRFRYFIPEIEDNLWDPSTVAALYGANPTPEVLWNLMPWSWLVDYFGNAGDVISNLSANAADNLVMDYGFVMGTVENRHKYASKSRKSNGTWMHLTAEKFEISKNRAVAFPYAFAPSASLSDYQLAILGALGLSKAGI